MAISATNIQQDTDDAVKIPEGCIPHLSVDNIVLGIKNKKLMVLLAKYNEGLAAGKWGLLGGWIKQGEHIDTAADRLLTDITGVQDLYLEQLRAFGDPNRYPADRVITITYYAFVRPDKYHLIPGWTASEVQWCDARDVPKLIFDHNLQIEYALEHLKQKIRFEPIGFNLLHDKFTLLELQEVYEAILNVRLDKPNFRRKIKKMNILIDCNEKQSGVTHRAANLYRFDKIVYEKLCEHGFSFEY